MIRIFLRTILGFLFCILIFIVVTKTLPLSGTIPVLAYQSIGSQQEAKTSNILSAGEALPRKWRSCIILDTAFCPCWNMNKF